MSMCDFKKQTPFAGLLSMLWADKWKLFQRILEKSKPKSSARKSASLDFSPLNDSTAKVGALLKNFSVNSHKVKLEDY